MKVKVKSNIRSPVEIGEEKIKKFIDDKAMEWEDSVKEILRLDVSANVMSGDVTIEIDKDGFVGVIDNPAAMSFEFGVDEGIVPEGIDIPVTQELAPMRRALGKI